MNINDFRTKYPELKDYSDNEIVTALQQTQLQDYTESEIAQGMGIHSSKYIDYETPGNKQELDQAAKQTQVKEPVEPSPDLKFANRLGEFINSDDYQSSTWDEQQKAKERFFNTHLANDIPAPYVNDYRKHFMETLQTGENKASYNRMKMLEKEFREDDPAYTNFFKRTGQSVLRGANMLFDGLETWERKSGLVPKDYYDKLRKGGWQDFGERYVRQKQYRNANIYDEMFQTVAEFSAPMVAGMMATVALGPSAPAVAGTLMELGVTSFTAIAAETGSRRQELASDPRYAEFLDSELDDMASEYGIYSGSVEGIGTLVGMKILKSAGSGLIKGLSKAGASKAVVQQSGNLLSKIQMAGNTRTGQYLKLVLAPIASGASEMSEELIQTHIGEALHYIHLNDDGETSVSDLASNFLTMWSDPDFQAELKHTAIVSFGAGMIPAAAINSVTGITKAKADIFSNDKDIADIDIAIKDTVKKIDADIESVKQDPKSTPEQLDELVKLREVTKRTEEALKTNSPIDAKTIEEEAAQEAERYNKLLASEEAEKAAIKSETVVEPKTIAPEVKAPEQAEIVSEERIKELRQIKVKDIGEMDLESVKELVSVYKNLKQRNQLDNSRFFRAKQRQEYLTNAETPILKPKAVKEFKQTGVLVDQDSRQNVAQTLTQVPVKEDVRPTRLRQTGMVNPTGQTLTKEAKLKGGLIFSRKGVFENTKGVPVARNIMDAPEPEYWGQMNRAILDNVESKIASGKWRYQELFDSVVKGAPNIEFMIDSSGMMSNRRGNLRSIWDRDTNNLKKQILTINPSTIDQMHGENISGVEVVMVHELLHALHSQSTGFSKTERAKRYYREIHDLWKSIPKPYMDQINFWADEFINRSKPKMKVLWDFYSDEQQAKRESWATLRQAITDVSPDSIMWDEVMSQFMSDPNLMSDVYKIPSQKNGLVTKDSLGKRLLKTFLKFINDILGKGTISASLMDDLLDIHERYTNSRELNRQSYYDIKPEEEHKNSLYIKGNKEFPKGSKFLNAAIKFKDGSVKTSTLGHWDIVSDWEGISFNKLVSGFAAVDSNGKVIEFYNRQEAAKKVDPRGKIVFADLLTEDLVKIAESQDSKILRKRNGKLEEIVLTEEQTKRRRRLTEADKALLEARKVARGGKSLVDTWAEKRKASQRQIAAVKYNQKIKQGIPGDRWSQERATDGLVSMKDNTLEKEYHKVLKILKDLTQRGVGNTHSRYQYYSLRRDAIELMQEKRLMDKMKAQKLQQREMEKKAGKTALSNIRFYKAEYKRLKRIDAPYSAVQFARAQLIDLMGNNFFTWSGEVNPIIKNRKEKEAKKVIAEKPLVTGAPKVKVIEPFTEEDAAKRAAKGDEEGSVVAKTPQEARDKFDTVMDHIKVNYISKGKKLPLEYIDKISETVLKQAQVFEVIDAQELDEAITMLANAMEGMEESFDSKTLGKHDPIQIRMDELMPVKVRFDAYHSKEEGYVPSGYMFTIVDPNHPANKSTFQVDDLTKDQIKKKFEMINRVYKIETTSQDSVSWKTIENSPTNTTVDSEPNANGNYVRIRMNHVPNVEDEGIFNDFEKGKKYILKKGLVRTNIEWELVDQEGNDTYDRKLNADSEDKKLGISAMRRIESILKGIFRGDYRATKPNSIQFSAAIDDPNKQKIYQFMSERIAKRLGWTFVREQSNIFYIFDSNYEPTREDLDRVKNQKQIYGYTDQVSDDAPDFDQVKFATEYFNDYVNNFDKDLSDTFYVPSGVIYKHSDGGNYYNLKLEYFKDSNQILVTGTHEHYDETVELFNELMPKNESEFKEALNFIKDQMVSKLENWDVLEELSRDSFNSVKHEFEDPNMERDALLGEAGIKAESWFKKSLDWLKKVRELSREFEPIKRKEYGDVQYALRQLKRGKEQAAQKAVDYLNNTLKSLNQTRFHNLQRLAYLMDLREQVIVNETKVANGESIDELVANPWGWSDEKIKKEAERIWNIVRSDEETYQAWRTRQDTWFRIRSAYKDAMTNVGFDAARRLNRIYYFRHQVLDVLNAERTFYGIKGSNKLAIPTSRSFLRKRTGAKGKPINFNYIQAEFEVMSQMVYDTQIANTLSQIMEDYGSKEKLEGYTLYRPREESIFYMANTVPGQLVQAAAEQGMKELNIPINRVHKALAFGGKYNGYYLPTELAQTLETALAERPYGPVMRGLRKALTAWKMWQLLNPLRALKYNLRNMTGDAEAVFIGSPGVFKYVPEAIRDLYNWQRSGKPSLDLKNYLDLGGAQATLQSQEISKIVEAPEFRKQLGKSQYSANPIAWGKSWFKLAKWGSDLREQMLRYAAYKKFLKEIRDNNGTPNKYVASLPEEIDVLKTSQDKAYTMANDLLGAYDRISVGGENLRRFWMPFWSFQEVNMKRSVTMFRNALNDDQAVGHVGRSLGAKSAVIALKVGTLAIKFMAISAAIQAWNEWMHGDAEDALPEEMRQRCHIILASPDSGNPKDTKIVYFPRIGVIGDLLEWGGFESAPSDARDIYQIITGETTWAKKTQEMHKVFGKYEYGAENMRRVVNKVVQSLGPQYKMPAEYLLREKFFPSIFNRQPITDIGRWMAEQTGFQVLYDTATKRPQSKDAFKKMAFNVAIYSEDKARLGWLAIQQRIVEYQRKNGLKGRGFIITETGNALYNMGLAWRYGDEKALGKYFAEYVTLSVNKLSTSADFFGSIKQQWEKLNPLASLPELHRNLFLASLDERGQKQLMLALQYYAEMSGGVQFTKGNK